MGEDVLSWMDEKDASECFGVSRNTGYDMDEDVLMDEKDTSKCLRLCTNTGCDMDATCFHYG